MLLRRPSAVSIAVVVVSLSVCILFIKHLKGVYEDNQKFKRLLEYKKYMNEVLEYMGSVENTANKSSEYYHSLSRHLPPLSKGN